MMVSIWRLSRASSCPRTGGPRPRHACVPAGGDSPDAAPRGNRIGGLIHLDKLEGGRGIEWVSRASQAMAFARISRARRSYFTSRRRRRISSHSAIVRPLVRRRSSHSAWQTKSRITWAVGSTSRASSTDVRPARTSSTLCRRNSGGHDGRLLGIADAFLPKEKVSTRPGQLHPTAQRRGNRYTRHTPINDPHASRRRAWRSPKRRDREN
jgi:hypothetical protein